VRNLRVSDSRDRSFVKSGGVEGFGGIGYDDYRTKRFVEAGSGKISLNVRKQESKQEDETISSIIGRSKKSKNVEGDHGWVRKALTWLAGIWSFGIGLRISFELLTAQNYIGIPNHPINIYLDFVPLCIFGIALIYFSFKDILADLYEDDILDARPISRVHEDFGGE